MKRREFLPGVFAALVGTQVPFTSLAGGHGIPPMPHPDSDTFWEEIRAQFRTGVRINLNNGGVSPHPLPVEEAFFNYHRIANEIPSYHMWRVLEKLRPAMKEKLADMAGCPVDEIATNRNATEALVTIIMNLPLKKGDEVVLSKFDYPRMVNAWKWRAERDGIVLRWVNPEEGMPDDAGIVKRYTEQFGKRTKVVHITHMINWTGRLVPAKAIIDKAKKMDITTVVDAAHSFAHIPFKISDLGCDYLGVSLHKWLCAPFGNGMLYARKEKIGELHSIFPTEREIWNDIKKFEELGTRDIASEMAISQAVDFHNHIGAQRKYDRLVELRDYWVNQVKDHPNIQVHTPLEPGRSGAITLLQVKGYSNHDADNYLVDNYGIHCVPIEREGIRGLRITPHIYTLKKELDLLVEGLLTLADKA